MGAIQTKLKNKAIERRKFLIGHISAIAKEKAVDQKFISNRTGILQPSISQSLSGDVNISLDRFCQICEAVGVKLTISEL